MVWKRLRARMWMLLQSLRCRLLGQHMWIGDLDLHCYFCKVDYYELEEQRAV
jgi:hypothetical protein